MKSKMKSFLDPENNMCKGPEAERDLAHKNGMEEAKDKPRQVPDAK